jgi:ribosomal subunit interface protein
MDITIRQRKTELPDEVRHAVEGKVARLARRLDSLQIGRAEIDLEAGRNPRIPDREHCEITVVGRGQVLRVSAVADECLVAVDRAVEKLEHRVEKLKGRLDERSHPSHKARNRRPGPSADGTPTSPEPGRPPGALG